MRGDHLPLKVGALIGFALICVLLFGYLYQMAGGRFRVHDPYHANVLVPDAFNIVLNSDVRRDGVKIGRVRKVEPAGGMGRIRFEIEDEAQARLYRNATVRVRTKTLVGESYLDIDPGDAGAGVLPSGATLPLEAAQESVPLERILNTLDGRTRREIRRNMAGLGDGLRGEGGKLNDLFGAVPPTVADGGRLMRVLKPQRRELAALLDNTGQVLDAFGRRSDALRTLAIDAKTTAEAAASRDARLRESIEELPATLRRAQSGVRRLASFSTRATPVFRDLRGASVNLAPALRDLEPAARDARILFRELRPFLAAVDPLLGELRPATRSLRTVVRPLDALLRQSNPALRYLAPYAPDAAAFFSNVGGFLDTPDALGYRGRVFPMIGKEQYTAYPPELRKVFDAFAEAGAVGKFFQTRTNPYPKPGRVGNETGFDGRYERVEADR